MFSKEDVKNIEGRGTSVEKVESQVERFKKGFPWMDIVAPAIPRLLIEKMWLRKC